ncbi:MAG: histidinol-phosphate transaminase [Thermodesulfobacteriota bacterium]
MNPSTTVRQEIKDFKPYVPGLSIEEIKQKYNLSNVFKLASNENPLGMSPIVKEEIQKNIPYCFRYPAVGNPELSSALASHHGLPSRNIVTSNGSDELIDLLIRVKGTPFQNNIVICDPSFSIYRMQARINSLEVRKVPLNDDFSFPYANMLQEIDEQTCLVFLTNPDNPSGYAASRENLLEFAEQLPQNCLLVIDEAYIDFAEQEEEFSPLAKFSMSSNIAILRTFSKMFGLAGLRLGYGIVPDWLADYILRIKLPFSVNILAEQAGLASLQDRDFYRATRETIIQGKKYLSDELEQLNCEVFPSQSNFILFRPPMDAAKTFQELLSRGVIIRPLDSYNLPQHLRVSIGNTNENKTFIKHLKQVLSEYESN